MISPLIMVMLTFIISCSFVGTAVFNTAVSEYAVVGNVGKMWFTVKFSSLLSFIVLICYIFIVKYVLL